MGNLRLRLPRLISSYNGTINATSFGNQCYQQAAPLGPNIPPEVLQGLSVLGTVFDTNLDVPQSEDCEDLCRSSVVSLSVESPTAPHTGLNLNVIRPANVPRDAKLPVLFVRHASIVFRALLTNVRLERV